ncbi:YbaK/EbsC family protein [Vannielia litorea]|uniref:Cys-tRNA(Pro) deacylase, prolyl-tRNA editing enzyme YbaK/EbsC n=1 Tax=Vannielia litorea TaxID=1217970 RepID=A0A1N6FMD9_9RHOB|nr:YbaK/EbsC family protein [Vannielia litorea]SIN96384.1 Cys-tRNA(Pro) deacylase, prolyl-tRNA editing enzyme YbaK/EbsC [Vannielia litorea]
MSKSLARVRSALQTAGLPAEIREMPESTRTAAEAAAAAGCEIDQIAKSIIFAGKASGALYLFLTAGGNQVDPAKASAAAGEPLARADGKVVRDLTGFAIGGVAPIGHLAAPRAFLDPRLLDFAQVWAAAGTPRHIFSIAPHDMARLADATTTGFTA